MLESLRFFVEFLLGWLKSILNLIPMMIRGAGMVNLSMALAPPFLNSIMVLMLAVIVVMWVVNIL